MMKPTYHDGRFDPLRTYMRLREAGELGAYSYVHVSPERVEIGWSPLDRVHFLDGATRSDWRAGLGAFAEKAAAAGSKAFGYVGFDAADSNVGTLPDGSATGCPLVEFIIPGELVTFTSARVVHHSSSGMDLARYLAVGEAQGQPAAAGPITPTSAVSDHAFMKMVEKATAHLRSRDLEKVVLSRFEVFDIDYDPMALLAAFCASPTLVDAFLISFGPTTAIISSPEPILSGRDREIEANPLAGTRPRGATAREDEALRTELKLDHKEVVEHVISVTTLLSELEPVCEPDSLVVQRLMDVKLQQRVQHLSSVIRGRVAGDGHVLDALWSLFPSITVSGYPKSRALELIRMLEAGPRWLYAGVCGWVCGAGDAHFSLAIRGVFRHERRSFLQVGAGIMAESAPESELMETRHKLSAMKEALSLVTAGAASSTSAPASWPSPRPKAS